MIVRCTTGHGLLINFPLALACQKNHWYSTTLFTGCEEKVDAGFCTESVVQQTDIVSICSEAVADLRYSPKPTIPYSDA